MFVFVLKFKKNLCVINKKKRLLNYVLRQPLFYEILKFSINS